jgi:beta-glucosidase/6-phospho-beta-glucosidase/beta-galactosidase
MLWDIIGVNYYVKKRSKENNRRAVEAVEDARTSAQPASLEVHHRREAASREGFSLCWLLCNEGPV